MSQVHVIRHKVFVEGLSIRSVAARRIDELLAEVGGRLSGKQRLTGTRIVEMLRERG